MAVSSGIDFGTSNSAVGLNGSDGVRLVALEDGYLNIPSTIFFDFDDRCTRFGRTAMRHYAEGASGRLMRSMKSVLGSALIDDRTRVGGQLLDFTDIIGMFIGHLKSLSETHADERIEDVVMGRPVFFVDGNPEADRAAEDALLHIARSLGYRNIAFQFEPVAAALDYERTSTREELALVMDIGGGTADFSIVRVSPHADTKPSREQDILGNHGVHVGGTDFDREFSLATVMPQLGYKSLIRGIFNQDQLQEAPHRYFVELATWHLINRQYDPANISEIRQMLRHAVEPDKIVHLLHVLESRLGSRVADAVETAKIELTEAQNAIIHVAANEGMREIPTTRDMLDGAIGPLVERLRHALLETLRMSGIANDEIDVVFLTGGSTQIPVVRQALVSLLPETKIVDGDKFGSVCTGLAIDARRKFGH